MKILMIVGNTFDYTTINSWHFHTAELKTFIWKINYNQINAQFQRVNTSQSR